jgi:hypothetical protein
MTPLIIARKKSEPNPESKVFLANPFLRYDSQNHGHIPIEVNPEDYQLIGESKTMEFYKLKKS